MSTETLADENGSQLGFSSAQVPPSTNNKESDAAFDDDQIETLITAVESRSALWDPALKEFRKTRGKTTAWLSVVKDVNEQHDSSFDLHAVQTKWNNLRDQFTRNHRNAERKKSGQGTAENIKIAWKWYNRLKFLRQKKKELLGVSQSNLKLTDDNACDSDIADLESNVFIPIDEKASASSSSTAVTPTPGKRNARKRRIDEDGELTSPQTKTQFMETFTKAADSVTSMSQQISDQLTQPSDQFTIFGNSLGSFVANELRSIHAIAPLGAMQLRHQLMATCSQIVSDWVVKGLVDIDSKGGLVEIASSPEFSDSPSPSPGLSSRKKRSQNLVDDNNRVKTMIENHMSQKTEYDWLGELVASQLNKIKNDTIRQDTCGKIQTVLREALVADRDITEQSGFKQNIQKIRSEIIWAPTDVTIITVDDKKIPAHKVMLSACSKVFDAMFKHPLEEIQEYCVTIIAISDFSPDVVREMIRFIYTESAPNLKDMTVELLKAADKYDLQRLKAMCFKALNEDLCVENAALTFKLANLYKEKGLELNVTQFIKDNYERVAKTPQWHELVKYERNLILESFCPLKLDNE